MNDSCSTQGPVIAEAVCDKQSELEEIVGRLEGVLSDLRVANSGAFDALQNISPEPVADEDASCSALPNGLVERIHSVVDDIFVSVNHTRSNSNRLRQLG